MEINDKKVLKQIGRLEVYGEHIGHTFEVTYEGPRYKYCVWKDGDKIIAMASCLTADELVRYVDGLRDMLLILKSEK